jgi:magnesium-transporting ATPase (P-type)
VAGEERAWHTLESEAVARALETDPAAGLDAAEAARRLERYGANRVQTTTTAAWWRVLLHQFLDPLIYILLIAAAVTLLVGDLVDTAVIAAVLLINASIGFTQELRARKAMESLAALSAPHALVVRDSESVEIEAERLVPGDVVRLASGDRAPADVRLVEARELDVDESALTGESSPVRKTTEALDEPALVAGDRTNMAYAGTSVTRGRGTGIVVATGAASELGQIAGAVQELGAVQTPIQQKVARLGRGIGVAIAGLSLVVAAVGYARGMSASDIVGTVVALAVAAVPEALPVVLTVTLAAGVRRMARRHAIIRALPAVETLGSTTVIASDKTGTLTRNEMTVRAVWAAGGRYDVSGVGYDRAGSFERAGEPSEPSAGTALYMALLTGMLASEAESLPPDADAEQDDERRDAGGDPTELALLVAATKAELEPDRVHAEHPRLDLLPFESERRFMASLHDGPDGPTVYVKGAPEVVLELCEQQLDGDGGSSPLDARRIADAATALAEEGLRVLAMAMRREDAERIDARQLGGLVLVGLMGLEDPLREEARPAVDAARRAGIRVLMLTGDHADTATAIGRQLDMRVEDGALAGAELARLPDEELDRRLARNDVYARVAPEHKLRLVERLKAAGQIVAVTGDGVNDAPALHAAHLGVAMGRSGTDVAREASDMVLTDDNFATITAAVEEGRVVFSNIRKVTYFLLSTAVGLVITILAALFAGWPLPYLAVQVLWINLVTSGLQDVALAFEPGEPGLLDEPPRPPDEGVVNRAVLARMLGIGAFLAAGTLLVFWYFVRAGAPLEVARSMAMTQMVVFNFFHVLNCRSMHRSVFQVPLLSNRFLLISIAAAAAAQAAILYVAPLQALFRTAPLSVHQIAATVAIGASVIGVAELDKLRVRRARAAAR